MSFVAFFKLPKVKPFRFTARYYDERKEEMEQRVARVKKEIGVTENSEEAKVIEKVYSVNIKGEMRNRLKKGKRSEASKSNIRLIFIIIILLGIAYFIIYH